MKNRNYYIVRKNEFETAMESINLKVRRGTLDILVSEHAHSPIGEYIIDGILSMELWNSEIEKGTVIKCYPLAENYSNISESIVILETQDDEVWYSNNHVPNVLYMSTVTCVEYDITIKEAKEKYLGIIENV